MTLVLQIYPPFDTHNLYFSSRTLRALSTFRKETDDGEELELHGAEVAALMNLVATDTLVEEAVALIPVSAYIDGKKLKCRKGTDGRKLTELTMFRYHSRSRGSLKHPLTNFST